MDFQSLIAAMTPEIQQQLKTAIELGKWPNGDKLTDKQKESALQATIAYGAKHQLNQGELFSVDALGELVDGKQLKAVLQPNKNREFHGIIDMNDE